VKVCGIAGSLRRDSYNRSLLAAAAGLAPERMTIAIFDRLGDVPLYDADVEARGDPEAVVALKSAIGEADALLIATPEYNHGIPGVLKNAIDWASRPPSRTVLAGKHTALIGASPGRTGTARAQLALRESLASTRTPILLGPELLVGEAQKKFAEDGTLSDDATRKFLRAHLERLLAWLEGTAKR
jgi:chromate reductase, NAD(P)H dehydrogenase (quinone)